MSIIDKAFDVCVLIPCYNNFSGLIASINSINYHLKKLVVLVVDDGSNVPVTPDKISQQVKKSLLVQVLRIEKNNGITQALNVGLKWIEDNLQVKYIARLDCADLCHKDRFYKQVAFLDANDEIGLIGSWCKFAHSKSSLSYVYITPIQHDEIAAEMHYRNVFIHPTVLFRTSLIKNVGYYPCNYPNVEDYAFFWRLIKHAKSAILDQILVTCEINTNGISIRNRQEQLRGRYKVVTEFGTHKLQKKLGLLKLRLMMVLPYKLILKLKQLKQISEQ